MKEVYTKPVADVETFSTVDVVTTSGISGGGGMDPIQTEPDWGD